MHSLSCRLGSSEACWMSEKITHISHMLMLQALKSVRSSGDPKRTRILGKQEMVGHSDMMRSRWPTMTISRSSW